MIEIYWATNIRDPQNVYAQPINLDLSEEELLREVERVSGQRPGSAPESNESWETTTGILGLRHVGWGVKDPAALAKFYRIVMGMMVVAETPADSPMGVTVFLNRHPEGEEHHDLVFFSNPMFAHTAFRIASLGDLLRSYRQVKERGIPIKQTFNHGVQLSFYFEDPEGHMIEIYWATYVDVPQDFRVQPLDLDRPEEEVQREVERMAEQYGRRAPSTLS
jgi:catechol-2,3-dioxygenase